MTGGKQQYVTRLGNTFKYRHEHVSLDVKHVMRIDRHPIDIPIGITG